MRGDAAAEGATETGRTLSLETVRALTDAMPSGLRALAVLDAGTGMRQGECLRLTMHRVDFLRRTLRVDRQLVSVPGHALHLATPKTHASHRDIPLPQVVVDALAQHLAEHPADDNAAIGGPLVYHGGWSAVAPNCHGCGVAKGRKGGRDAGHLQPPLAGLGRPHAGRSGLRYWSSCGLPAD